MPEIFFESLDKVPDFLREVASEKDGKVSVNVVPKKNLDEFREKNIALSQERDGLVTRVQKYAEVIGEDFDAFKTDLDGLRAIKKKVDDKELVATNGLDEAVATRTQQMRADYDGRITALTNETKAWKEKATTSESKLKRFTIDHAITAAVLDPKSGALPNALPHILRSAYDTWKVDDNGKMTPYNGDQVAYGTDGSTPQTPAEWLAAQKESAPYFFQSSNGGGAGGGGSGKATKTINYQDRAGMGANLEDIASGKAQVIA